MVYNLPAHVIAAKEVQAVFDIAIYRASSAKSRITTRESLTHTLNQLVSDSIPRARSHILASDWVLESFDVEADRELSIRFYRITLYFRRLQYEGSSRAGLERLLSFIEGTLWGAHGIKAGGDGDPVVTRITKIPLPK